MLASAHGPADAYEMPSPLPFFGTKVDTYDLDFTTESATIGFSRDLVFLPLGYVSETPLSASMTVVDRNFDDFNLIAGESYSISWAEGTADEDSLIVNIVSEPVNFTLSPSIANGQFVISYASDSAFTYQLEQSGDLNSGSWTNHGNAVNGTDATNSFTINPANAALRYYRVQSHLQQ